MQKEAEDSGYKLNGVMAMQIVANPGYYQDIAKKALEKFGDIHDKSS